MAALALQQVALAFAIRPGHRQGVHERQTLVGAADAYQAGAHANLQDHVRSALRDPPAAAHEAERGAGRLRPEGLPPAGGRVARHAVGEAPFGRDEPIADGQAARRCERGQDDALWNAAYTRPQFARKRCPDLMATGPTMRSAPPAGPGAAAPQGVYAYEPTVTSTTTYLPPS
jgi:hypothetical protein